MRWLGVVLVLVLVMSSGCGGDAEVGDPYVGEWEGEWFAEEKGAVSATVKRVEGGGYRAEVRDGDGDVVTWLAGEEVEGGVEFETTVDSPDRYLGIWRGEIGEGGGDFVGQAYPAREYGGFEMRRK